MKTVLISGGTDGIGKGTILKLLEEGFSVATFSRDQKKCISLEKDIQIFHDRVLVLQGNVTDEKDVERIVQETLKKFSKIDILINNAGFGYFADCDKVDISKFRDMLETNITGAAALTKAVVPHMKQYSVGLIINMVSISGKTAFAQGEFYSATKFALMGYSEGIRTELKPYGIKVCTVCPGMVRTSFFDESELERREKLYGKPSAMLETKDVARILVLICTQSAQCDIQDVLVRAWG